MNYGVKKAIAGTRRGFRKAGQALQNFDDAYSAKIRDMYEGANPAVKTAGTMFLGGHPSLRKGVPLPSDDGTEPQGFVRAVAEYGLPAVNAVPKYVLPAVGVGLAAKGISDIVTGQTGIGSEADGQQPAQLRM